ncbi:hypothetical protein TorRG33x02_015400 [Trema orientale]|uniref:Uncharacterized protein n=1 Tax=Trema orientale TaxID=63057 RepID=A0A2P5FXN2_TREOI|nr:hypothetical protein TorRG33x02_015400 [Trema orientale]
MFLGSQEEDYGAGYLVQPVVQAEEEDGGGSDMDPGNEEEGDGEEEEEVEDDDEIQVLPPSSSTQPKRKRDEEEDEDDGEDDEDDDDVVEFSNMETGNLRWIGWYLVVVILALFLDKYIVGGKMIVSLPLGVSVQKVVSVLSPLGYLT